MSGGPNEEKSVQETVPRVLLAEDHDDMRNMLAVFLVNSGWDVVECRDGVEFLTCLCAAGPKCSKGFDLIIADVRMPSLSGLEALRIANRRRKLPPVVVITAFGDQDAYREAADLGVKAVLSKPFEIENLLAKARQILADSPGRLFGTTASPGAEWSAH